MSPSEPRRANRRCSIRRRPKHSTRAVCPSGRWGLGPNIAVEVLDISETGARLRVRIECRRGQEIELQFASLCTPNPLTIAARVMWCVRTADDNFCIGVHFNRPLSYRLIQSL